MEPAGDSCLCIVCNDPGNFSIVNREAVMQELKEAVEKNYGKSIYFKANLNDTGAKSTTLYVSDDDLKVIHDDIIVED